MSLLAVQSGVAHAQPQLEEIIVTAQKRAENLQDVPISLSAVQGEKIKEAGITDMPVLADYVPNLYIEYAAVNTNIYMRGVGSGNNQGFEQSVGMYVDGIYMGRGHQYRTGFLDLERVEVLRGPQGTLFGRNTIAGAVNITTASPMPGDETSGEIAVSVEENDGLITEGFVSGSLTDTFAARLAFKYRETDGYIENTFNGQDEPAAEATAYRITLAWQPTENLDLNLKYSRAEEDLVGAPSATWLYLDPASRSIQVPNRSAFASIAYLITDTVFPTFGEEAGEEWTTIKDGGYGQDDAAIGIGRYPDSVDSEVDNLAFKADLALGDYTLTAVTGQSEYEFKAGADVDWLPLQFISRDDDQSFEQFSQELRLTSPGGEFFDFVVGGYYDTSTVEIDRLVVLDLNMDGLVPQVIGLNSLLTLLTAGAYNAEQIARNHTYELGSESWAAFAQGTFNFTAYLRLSLGVRYTQEEKDVTSAQFLADSELGYDTPNDNYYLHRIQAQNFNSYEFHYVADRSTDDLIPAVNLQWDVTPDDLLYMAFSQGFKSGGFTDADDGEPGDLTPASYPCAPGEPIEACYDPTRPNTDFEFDDESVDAFEIGGKHKLLDGAMTLNWAAFYTEYDNLQTAIFKGVGFTTTNAGSSKIQGIEADLRWLATENLMLGINAAWLDATYAEFENAPCTAIQLDANPFCGVADPAINVIGTMNDLSGEPTGYASEYSASLTWDYSYPLNAVELFVGGEVNYRDEFAPTGDADPIDHMPDYTLVNLRLGVRAGHWEAMAYGRNIFNDETFSQSFDTPVLAGSHTRFMGEGAVFGLRAKYKF